MIYAFIPARSGSKRLKDKNYLMLKDKRLFEWSIECANNTKKIEKIIFSTDSNKYIEYAKSIRKQQFFYGFCGLGQDHRDSNKSGSEAAFGCDLGPKLDKCGARWAQIATKLGPSWDKLG